MLAGVVHHRDTLGNAGEIGAGDVQWMTAGGGIMHEEMPQPGQDEMIGFRTILLNFFLFLNGLVVAFFSLLVIAYCLIPEKLGILNLEEARLNIPLVSGVWETILILFSLLMIILNLLLLLKGLKKSSREVYIQSNIPDGEGPGVSLGALENSLLRVARKLPEIKKMLDFLDEDFDPTHYEHVKTHPIQHDHGKLFSDEELRRIERLCRRWAVHYGYFEAPQETK